MHQSTTSARPDPHLRLERLKLVIGGITGVVAAGLWWMIAAQVVEAQQAQQLAQQQAQQEAERPIVITIPANGDAFFGTSSSSSSSLSNAGRTQIPILRSSGS